MIDYRNKVLAVFHVLSRHCGVLVSLNEVINGKKVKGEFAGIACGNLLLNNCSVKNKNSIRHKVNNAFVPIDYIKRIELG